MGVLSNAKALNVFSNVIAKYNNKICLLCYLVGLLWFLSLAYVQMNARTYFSENSLLPGLVDPDFQHAHGSNDYYQELKEILKNLKLSNNEFWRKIPSEWLIEKFSELRLDVYNQNYTFKYPYNILRGQMMEGQNTYAILRAARSAGTEAVVLSSPFRPDEQNTLAGIALMIGLAKAFKRHSYWAKDIIFLITDNEEIGMQAWLSAYHHTYNNLISAGELVGRSGSIQAAINIEIGMDVINRMDIKIEGLNGQLPNLDLFNTAVRLCRRENIVPTLHKRVDYWNSDSWDGFEYSLKSMLLMMWNQLSGSPSGNHGLFHRYNIEALTLHGIKLKNSKQNSGFSEIGRVIEGIFRSLNNLQERFHQSFFFYLLPSTERYVSIGLYMPPIGILLLPIAIKAIALWLSVGVLSEKDKEEKEKKEKEQAADNAQTRKVNRSSDSSSSSSALLHLFSYLPYFLMAFFFGGGSFYGPQYFVGTAVSMHLKPETGLAIGLLAVHVAVICYPIMTKWRSFRNKKTDALYKSVDFRLLKCFSLLLLAIVLGSTAVVNISLAFFVASLWVPITLLIQPINSRFWQLIQFLFLVIISPFGMAFIAASINQLFLVSSKLSSSSFSDDLITFVTKVWQDIENGLLMIAVQSEMLGNWTYVLVSLLLLPIWILFYLIPSCQINS